MENYHKHTCYSNVFIADSAVQYEDYAKRAVELGHKTISSVEHGWQSNYYVTYDVAKKHGLKFLFGTEAYWVKDRREKDRSNCHIVLLAKSELGRRAINRVLSEANETGYYFRPRVDVELLLSLPPGEVFVTSACVGFWNYEDAVDVVHLLHGHFKQDFMLEIQYHNTGKQINLNRQIAEISQSSGIPLIVGLDSHYIYPEQSVERDFVLAAKHIQYGDEEGWFMDYPDEDTVFQRFLDQGVFDTKDIRTAMNNSNIVLEFDHIHFNDDIKLPTLYPGYTQEQKNDLYSRLVSQKFKEYTKDMPAEEYRRYLEGTKQEVQVIKNTGMADYFLFDYEIVRDAVKRGGIITNSGRGSAVGYFTNTLLGFSKVDRFQSPITLYPERFISESRILETRSLPDLDLNLGNPEVFAESQERVLGKGHVYPMIAFGTFKKKSAFKLYARAKDLDFAVANAISQQLEQYETALKYADDDERDEINIYDYVEEQYHDYITQSQAYWGMIADKKKAPCAYLLYQGDIREEIGLIKCKSDSTKKECITTVIDGAIAEKYKFLKNDLLKVDVVLLIAAVYDRIGLRPHTVTELQEIVKGNQKVWDIYAKGLTIGINQVERASTTQKVMKYKPRNVSELAAFVAAIRPAFKSMYHLFESRQPFSYGIRVFDDLIQTEEFPQSFILYQEQAMNTLHYAGFPLDECYGIIKAIAKKHPEKVRPLKERFIVGFKARIMRDDNVADADAQEMSESVWQIISDSCGYGFNSSHAYCMALDSLYNAYLKSHYPYAFYEVLLQSYSDKGNKDKVLLLKREMLAGFGIKEGGYRWGADNRKFVADKESGVINPSLLSIKGLSQKYANDLYALSKAKAYPDFCALLPDVKKLKSGNSQKLLTLIRIGYFSSFGGIRKLEAYNNAYDYLHGRTQFSKEDVDKQYLPYIQKHSTQSEKQYREFDCDAALRDLWDDLDDTSLPIHQVLKYQLDHLGYVSAIIPKLSSDYVFVTGFECKYKNPILTLYQLNNGDTWTVKIRRRVYDTRPINVGDLIILTELSEERKWKRTDTGEFYQIDELELILLSWKFVR